jgi:hypothetical protein
MSPRAGCEGLSLTQERPAALRTWKPMTKQAAVVALAKNRGELDAAALAKLLAATKR